MRASVRAAAAVAALIAVAPSVASAQGNPPLPPLPPPTAEPPSAPPPAGTAPGASPPVQEPPPVVYAPPAPPPVVYIEPEPPIHAPRYSLWVGGRLGLLAYAGGLYADPNMGATETTGNFVRPGLGIELDAGARLARRYIPYVALELGAVPPGRRFDPANTSARTSFLGFGFRLLSGDVDSVAFASDISFGRRTFSISSDGSTWSASGWEYFRLGLGVEVRVNDRFTVSPLVSFSEGSLTDTSGSVKFAPNQPDGMVGPPYSGTGGIPGFGQSNYFTVMVGCGAHVDLFGR